MTATFQIVRDGFFFRAVNASTGWKSGLMTSPSQAGLLIQRKAGKEEAARAAAHFLSGR